MGLLHLEVEIETYETFCSYDMKDFMYVLKVKSTSEYKVLQNLGKHKCDIGCTKLYYRSASKFVGDVNTIT